MGNSNSQGKADEHQENVDGSGGEDTSTSSANSDDVSTGSTSSEESIVCLNEDDSSSDEEDQAAGGADGGHERLRVPPHRNVRIARQQSDYSFASRVTDMLQQRPAVFTFSSSILSFINLVVVAYLMDGNLSGLNSFLIFISNIVGIYAFNNHVLPTIRQRVMNDPVLLFYLGPIIGANRPTRSSQLAYQLRGATEVNIAATTINLLASGLSTYMTARYLDIGIVMEVGSFAFYHFTISRLMRLVAAYIDGASEEFADRIICILGQLGSGIRDRVGLLAILRWVRNSMSPSQYALPARPGEAVRRQDLQERGAEIISVVVGASIFFGNLSNAGLPWAAILGSFSWGATRLPLFGYMGLMRMAQQADIRARFRDGGPYAAADLAEALVIEGSAIPTIAGDILASVGIVGGRVGGIVKWVPLILLSKALPKTAQNMLNAVIGTNIAADSVNLVYAVDGILDPNVPPEDVINHVYDNSPVTAIKRTFFFVFWIGIIYSAMALASVVAMRHYEVFTSQKSFDALYAAFTILGVLITVIAAFTIYSNIEKISHRTERNCIMRPMLRSSCFRAWWGYVGGSEGQTPQEQAANLEAQGRLEAIIAEEERIGARHATRRSIAENRRAPGPLNNQQRIIPMQDGTNMVLELLDPNPENHFIRYRVVQPEQNQDETHIREVQIHEAEDDHISMVMSDGRVITRREEDVQITDQDGVLIYNSAFAFADPNVPEPQMPLRDLVNNMMLDPEFGTPRDLGPEIPGLAVAFEGDLDAGNLIPLEESSDEEMDAVAIQVDVDDVYERRGAAHVGRSAAYGGGDLQRDAVAIQIDAEDVFEHQGSARGRDDSELRDNGGERSPLLEGGHAIGYGVGLVPTNTRFSINSEESSDEESVTQKKGNLFSRMFRKTSSSTNITPEERISLLSGQSEGAEMATRGHLSSEGSEGVDSIQANQSNDWLYNSSASYEYFQDSSPDTIDLFERPFEVLLEPVDDTMELFERSEDENSDEEMAEMRISMDQEIKVKDVHDYENDGPIKPKEQKRETLAEKTGAEDWSREYNFLPEKYDYFNIEDDPTKSKRFGDPDSCQHNIFGYCTDNAHSQLMGLLMMAPMMFVNSK